MSVAAQTVSVEERRQRQAEVVAALKPLLPAHALLWQAEDTTPYECDGLTAYRERPLVVGDHPGDEIAVGVAGEADRHVPVHLVVGLLVGAGGGGVAR